MNIDLLKITGSIVGAIISLKILFFIFNPSELLIIILIGVLLFISYGIHSTEWDEHSSFSIFGINIYNSKRVFQQYRILGIIPLSRATLVRKEHSVFDELNPTVALPLVKTTISALPFGALLLTKVGNK